MKIRESKLQKNKQDRHDKNYIFTWREEWSRCKMSKGEDKIDSNPAGEQWWLLWARQYLTVCFASAHAISSTLATQLTTRSCRLEPT